jgi:hypothetical protein
LLGAAAGTGDTARAEEARTAQEEVAATLRDEETRKRADLETRRSTRTLKDITARQEELRVIRERREAEEEKKTLERRRRRRSRLRGPRLRGPRPPLLLRLAPTRAAPEQQAATEEEKKTGQQARLSSIGEQLASLVAQPLMRWLSTVPADARMGPAEVQLVATETLAPADARMGPAEVQLAATETLAPADARMEPTEDLPAARNGRPMMSGMSAGAAAATTGEDEPEEPGKQQELDPDWDEWPPDWNDRLLPFRLDRSRQCGAEDTAEEDAMTALLDEEAREKCEPEAWRLVFNPEDIATREKLTRAIHEKQAAVDEPRGMQRA